MTTAEELEAAQAKVDEAREKLRQEQLAAEAAQRPFTALNGIEGYLIHLPAGIADEFASLVAKARATLSEAK